MRTAMLRSIRGRLSACFLVLLAACASAPEPSGARLYEGFGHYQRRVATSSAEAQRWFDQGMQLLYGFNHDEAIRSFHEATRIDPDCAMAWWGVAYAHGLHINNPSMSEESSKAAYEAALEAQARIAHATDVERALIRAVARRYAWPVPEDRSGLDQAYAAAMGEVWRAFPGDPDVGALYAESLMNLQPWDLWTHAGEPKGRTLEIVEVLERVLALDPRHPGANHFYIHAVEASKTPERAVPAAERLAGLVPGSGHLVHMPSHIFMRVGRYSEAADANVRAIAADKAYFQLAPPPRFYSLYFVHNIHFLAYAAMMECRFETALAAARQLEDEIPEDFLEGHMLIADGFMPTALHVLIRFGRWEEILREPTPPAARLVSRAFSHYARAIALANLERVVEARAELAAFDALAQEIGSDWSIGNNPAPSILPIARGMAEGEILFREGERERAFESLRAAVALEDQLVYDEPPGWMQPVRHALGALLLVGGRNEEALAVYREDLDRHPANGWALLGLEQALAALGRESEARRTAEQRKEVWKRADQRPKASCYCGEKS